MNNFWRCFLMAFLLCTACEYSRAAKIGDVLLSDNFESAAAAQKWSATTPTAQLVAGENGGQVLQVTRTDKEAAMLQMPIAVEDVRGAELRISVRIKAENVSAPPQPWNGIKAMLHIAAPGGDMWPQQNLPGGSFDWKNVRFATKIPRDATKITVLLGLEEVTGRAWFDDIKIEVLRLPRIIPAKAPTGPRFKGHDLPRLRGVMIDPNLKASDLRVLASWNVNVVRWQLTWNGFPASPADNGDLAAYSIWLESALKKVDAMLPLCRELGIRVVLDLHTMPGGVQQTTSQTSIFHEKRFQTKFVDIWGEIARRYKNQNVIWGYDLGNEPIEGDIADGLMNWHDLALAAAKRIRIIDAQVPLIVEAPPGGGPDGLADFEPLPVKNVVYSFHFYLPHAYSHQGVYGSPVGTKYPGVIGGQMWDKAMLRRSMQGVIDWQRAYNTHVYVGEFSAIRWAPGARDYLRDSIDIFEENDWDWSYHAFREWTGWSVEHSDLQSEENPTTTPTTRQVLLRSWFAKNVRKPIAAAPASTRKPVKVAAKAKTALTAKSQKPKK